MPYERNQTQSQTITWFNYKYRGWHVLEVFGDESWVRYLFWYRGDHQRPGYLQHKTQPLYLIHEQKETLSHATRLVPWVTLLLVEMKNNLNLRRKIDHSLAELTDFGDSFSFNLAASHQNETPENWYNTTMSSSGLTVHNRKPSEQNIIRLFTFKKIPLNYSYSKHLNWESFAWHKICFSKGEAARP